MKADELLESPDPDETEDAVLDFIESEVGRIRFNQNWPKIRNKMQLAQDWLAVMGYNTTPEAVVAGVQKLWAEKVQWPDPFQKHD